MNTVIKRHIVPIAAGLSLLVVPVLSAADDVRGARTDGPAAEHHRGSIPEDPLAAEDERLDERLARAPGVEVEFEGPSDHQPESVPPPPEQRGPEQRGEVRPEQQPRIAQQQPVENEGSTDAAEATQADVHQVSGRILRTKTVEVRGTGQRNFIAMIDTNRGDERLIVDLGPVAGLEQLDLRLGSHIAVEGRIHEIGDRSVLVADRVRSGNRIAQVDRSAQADQHASLEQRNAEMRASIDSYPMMP